MWEKLNILRGIIADKNVKIGLDYGICRTAVILLEFGFGDKEIIKALMTHFFLGYSQAEKALTKAKRTRTR